MPKNAKRTITRIAVSVLLLLAALIGTWQLSKSRSFQFFGKIVTRVETSERVVALTFDDGPTGAYTPWVLALLKDKHVTATFFLVGESMDEHPELAKAIAGAGHEIGNHTYQHRDMTLASEAFAQSEVERTDAAIRRAGYNGEILFREAGCKKLIGLPLYLSKHNRTTITWDLEPETYRAIAADPARLTSYVVEKARPGSIVLLHVMFRSRATTRAALPGIIDGLRARGFRFVTVSQLLAMGAPKPALVR